MNSSFVPGEIQTPDETLELNAGRKTIAIEVANSGDRPIQVGSHFGFYETNRALQFDRESAFNMRLDIAAGTAVRFEPGETKAVTLVEIGGAQQVFGLNGLSDGASTCSEARGRLNAWEQL